MNRLRTLCLTKAVIKKNNIFVLYTNNKKLFQRINTQFIYSNMGKNINRDMYATNLSSSFLPIEFKAIAFVPKRL